MGRWSVEPAIGKYAPFRIKKHLPQVEINLRLLDWCSEILRATKKKLSTV